MTLSPLGFVNLSENRCCKVNLEFLELVISPEVQRYTTPRIREQIWALMISTAEPERISLGQVWEMSLSQTVKIPREDVTWFLERLEALVTGQLASSYDQASAEDESSFAKGGINTNAARNSASEAAEPV
jgi:hypothetical protein